jgi:hypothetical protein
MQPHRASVALAARGTACHAAFGVDQRQAFLGTSRKVGAWLLA